MTNSFLTYGNFAAEAAVINYNFCKMMQMNEDGRTDEFAFTEARYLKERAEKRIEDDIDNLEHKYLSDAIIQSAKAGLRVIHLYDDVCSYSGKRIENAAKLNDVFQQYGINEITVEGGWSGFDATLEGFLSVGWQVAGIHHLPERYVELYGGPERTIHLIRPAIPAIKEDWED